MKKCSKCGADMPDDAQFCTTCGQPFPAPQQAQPEQPQQAQAPQQSPMPIPPQQGQPPYGQPQQPPYAAPIPDPFDHTAEYSAKDISDNKVIAMLCYLLGTIGVIIALLGSQSSPYAAFHVRQALKFTVVDILLGIIAAVLCFTILVPIACGICYAVLFVVRIICFFSICSGKAKEAPIVRSLGFLH